MNDEILGLLTLVTLLIFGMFLINLRPEGFDDGNSTNTTLSKLSNLVRIQTDPLPEGEEATVVRPDSLTLMNKNREERAKGLMEHEESERANSEQDREQRNAIKRIWHEQKSNEARDIAEGERQRAESERANREQDRKHRDVRKRAWLEAKDREAEIDDLGTPSNYVADENWLKDATGVYFDAFLEPGKNWNIQKGASSKSGAWDDSTADYKNNYSKQADQRREQSKRLTNTDLLETKAVKEIGKQRGRGGYLDTTNGTEFRKMDTTSGTEFRKRDTMKISGEDYAKELKKYTTLYENTDLAFLNKSSSRRINFEKEQAKKPEPQGVEEIQEYFAQV